MLNIVKNPGVRIDIMVLEAHWPTIVSMIKKYEGTYYKEDRSEIKGKTYILIRDVKVPKSYQIMNLFFDIYTFDDMVDEPIQNAGFARDRIYILIKPRKKGKKHVQKDREEVSTGSEGGNGGEPADNQSGEDPGTGGSGAEPADVGDFSPVQLEIDLDIPEINTDSDDQ